MRKYRFWAMVCLLGLYLSLAGTAAAAPQTITAAGVYTMGDGETLAAAKERARAEAMRAATEQAGVYLESTTEVRNWAVTQDEVRAIAGSILTVQDTRYTKAFVSENSIQVTATITALVDPLDMDTLRSRLREKKAAEDYAALKEAYAKSQADSARLTDEVASLKEQLAAAPTPAAAQQLRTDIARNEQVFGAAQWLEKGNLLQYGRHDYYGAVDAYSQAIAYDAQYAEAYRQRGNARKAKGDTLEALADYGQAIRLEPQTADTYVERARLYLAQRRYQEAVNDYTLALNLAPTAASYAGRGDVEFARHDWEAALADYEAAAGLEDGYAAAWYGEGRALEQLGRKAEAAAAYQRYLDTTADGSYSAAVVQAKKRIEALQAG